MQQQQGQALALAGGPTGLPPLQLQEQHLQQADQAQLWSRQEAAGAGVSPRLA
jgi:hypothetical protein